MSRVVTVHDSVQDSYSYQATAEPGKNFDAEFKPEVTPQQMLELGVFGGRYFDRDQSELPDEWFVHAKLSDHGSDPKYNYFKIAASQPLKVWQAKGWIYPEDPRGWFQWYCRYYLGRRLPEEDARQIKRWKAVRRHISQLQKNCMVGDEHCRPRQRQALLHWAYDSRAL